MKVLLDVTNMRVRKGDRVTLANLGRIAARRLTGDARGIGIRGKDRVSSMPSLLLQRTPEPVKAVGLPEPRVTLADLGIQLADGPTAGRNGFFSLSRELITIGQFRQFMERTGHGRDRLSLGGKSFSSVELVEGCTYEDVLVFCQWLSNETGRQCGLPSAATLESCRGTGLLPQFTSRFVPNKLAETEQVDIYELTSTMVEEEGKKHLVLVSLSADTNRWPIAANNFPGNTGFRVEVFTPYDR